ncbi:hypothetical protein BASA81_014032 [Batrachochytrium salamandrivorans]|nr:hypothetical protein BASA81_014032 [Batrachochytrium salamandrivorans]
MEANSVVSFAYKNQVDGIGSELFQFSQDLDTSAAAAAAAQAAVEANQQRATAAAAASPTPSTSSGEDDVDGEATLTAKTSLAKAQTHFALMDSEELVQQQRQKQEEEEESARVLAASLTVAYNDANLRCEQLESHLRAEKQRLMETTKLRNDLHMSLQRLNKSLSGRSSGEEEEEEEGRPHTPSTLSTRKPRKSAVAKPASALQVGKRQKYDSDDDEYGSEEAELDSEQHGLRNPRALAGKLTRVSSGACPECGKMRHRDKKLNPNVCPFLLWTKDFGKHVPRKPGDDTLLCAQKLAWPLVKRHFVDDEGMYIKLEGANWNGPASAIPVTPAVEIAAPVVTVAAPPPPPPHNQPQ